MKFAFGIFLLVIMFGTGAAAIDARTSEERVLALEALAFGVSAGAVWIVVERRNAADKGAFDRALGVRIPGWRACFPVLFSSAMSVLGYFAVEHTLQVRSGFQIILAAVFAVSGLLICALLYRKF